MTFILGSPLSFILFDESLPQILAKISRMTAHASQLSATVTAEKNHLKGKKLQFV